MKTITQEEAAKIANDALDKISAALTEAGINHEVMKGKIFYGNGHGFAINCYHSSDKNSTISTSVEIIGISQSSFMHFRSERKFKSLQISFPVDHYNYRGGNRPERMGLDKALKDVPAIVQKLRDRLEKELNRINDGRNKAKAVAKMDAVIEELKLLFPHAANKCSLYVDKDYCDPKIQIRMSVDEAMARKILAAIDEAVKS